MNVELDVLNRDVSLARGMYPAVKWPISALAPGAVRAKSSIVATTERTFVIWNRNGRVEWVDVKKGIRDGDLWRRPEFRGGR